MQEPAAHLKQRKRRLKAHHSQNIKHEVPQRDIIEETVAFVDDETFHMQLGYTRSSSGVLLDDQQEQNTIILSGSDDDDDDVNNDDDERLDATSDDTSDIMKHELRSKIAQQQLVNKQQHRLTKVNKDDDGSRGTTKSLVSSGNSSTSRSRKRSNKSSWSVVNDQTTNSTIELLTDHSDHHSDVDNTDTEADEKSGHHDDHDKEDDRDHDVREIYNRARLTTFCVTDCEHDYDRERLEVSARLDTEGNSSGATNAKRSLQQQGGSSCMRPRKRRAASKHQDKWPRRECNNLRVDCSDSDALCASEGNQNQSLSLVGSAKNVAADQSAADLNNNYELDANQASQKCFINRNDNKHKYTLSPDLEERYSNKRPWNGSSHSNKNNHKCSEYITTSDSFSGLLKSLFQTCAPWARSTSSNGSLCLDEVLSGSLNKLTKKEQTVNSVFCNIKEEAENKVHEWQNQQEPSTSGKKQQRRQRQRQLGQSMSPTIDNNRYQSLDRPISRRSSRISRPRETFFNDGYSRLGHSYYQKKPKTSFFHEFKRFMLLLLILIICGLVLWQIYEVLIEEDNYLGTIKYSPSELGKFKHYTVSTDAEPCAQIGKKLLAKGGHAVDAAIGTLICMGVALPNSLGLGGGCLMTIYDNVTKTATVIDGRETAPDYANENMFAANHLEASRGALSVGVPGELAAYWEAHQRFGRLNWSELFDDSINLSENGFPTVEHLSFALRDMTHAKYISQPLAKILTNNATGEYYSEGQIMYQPELAKTLRRIRDNGVAEFYNGTTARLFIEDLQKQGGKMTLDNLSRYKADVKQATEFKINDDLRLLTQPVPGSGVVLGIILKIMKELGYYRKHRPREKLEASGLYYHHLTEAFKFSYAQRAALEDDPDNPKRMEELIAKITSDKFIQSIVKKITNDKTHSSDYYGGLEYFQEDHGTAHASIVDSEGNSVAVTTSINLYFGSGLVSPSTGIIYNDVMDDFTSPNITNKFGLLPSKYNRIKPGRRPFSSMAPSIFVDGEGRPRLVIGASGGSKITTAIASVALRNLFFDEDIKTAIDGPRIHHQFLPDKVWFEANFPSALLDALANRVHGLKLITGRSSVVMAIACQYGNDSSKLLTANSDYRKGGTVDGV